MPDNPTRKTWYEVLAALTPLIVGICVSGVGAFYTHQNNERQLQLNRINALDKFRGLLTSSNEADREFAYASFAALGYEELALKIIKAQRDTAGAAVVKAAPATAEKAEAQAALASVGSRVYLHIADEAQRPAASVLAASLRRLGYAVQGIERVAAVPKESSVRYFNDADAAGARDLAQALKMNAVPDATAQQVKGFQVRPGNLEVWLSPAFR